MKKNYFILISNHNLNNTNNFCIAYDGYYSDKTE